MGDLRFLAPSSTWSESLVEQVAEPRLDYIDFGARDRDIFGPIIGDSPGVDFSVGFWIDVRPSSNPRRRDAAVGSDAARIERICARSRHLGTIARSVANKNGLILRRDALSYAFPSERARPFASARAPAGLPRGLNFYHSPSPRFRPRSHSMPPPAR